MHSLMKWGPRPDVLIGANWNYYYYWNRTEMNQQWIWPETRLSCIIRVLNWIKPNLKVFFFLFLNWYIQHTDLVYSTLDKYKDCFMHCILAFLLQNNLRTVKRLSSIILILPSVYVGNSNWILGRYYTWKPLSNGNSKVQSLQ